MNINHPLGNDRYHLATPYIGLTMVRPLPKDKRFYPTSYLTNPHQDIQKTLLDYKYTGESQTFCLDNERSGYVTVEYVDEKARVYDMEDNLIAEDDLNIRDIDKMLVKIALDVTADAELWLNDLELNLDE